MSQEIKEAIELLEKVDKHIIHHTCGYTLTQDLKTLKGYVQQAIALFCKAPEQLLAGKFTNEIRRRLNEIGRRRQLRPIEKSFLEACDIIDRSEASRKELLALCEEFMEIADDGSAKFDDPVPGSIYLRAKAAINKAQKEE